jgi:hypothetical protein
MFDVKKLRESAMRNGMKLMGDPRVMKFMSSPQGQKLMMFAFQLPQRISGIFEAQGKRFARRFKLATRQDLRDLRQAVHDLEAALEKLQSRSGGSNGREHASHS